MEQIKVMIQYCLESSIENDETLLKLDRKALNRETNKKMKMKMFELLTKGRAPVFSGGPDYAACTTLPLRGPQRKFAGILV